MPETLEGAKSRLQRSFLGRGGIHGVGVSRAKQAIRVYVSPQVGTDQSPVLEELRTAAQPFAVIIVEEEPPQMT